MSSDKSPSASVDKQFHMLPWWGAGGNENGGWDGNLETKIKGNTKISALGVFYITAWSGAQ